MIALLLFGGETLKNFAFALMIGIASGAYSSIFIASPVLTEWKEREGSYRSRRARIVRELGAVPAYATALGGEPVDVEPAQDRKRTRRGSITAPQEPGEQISRDEFQELVRDLDVDAEPKQQQQQKGRAAVAQRGAGQEQPDAGETPRADARPGGGPDPGGSGAEGSAEAQRAHQTTAQQTAREITLMGMLGWVMMGLAIWHFTIFLPDRFWGGIVGAFVGSLVGAVVVGLLIYGVKVSALEIPGQKATDIEVVLYAVPGGADWHRPVYLEGIRRASQRG